MHELPTEWTALCALVFLLGLKHGFDADHLATIDGLTRYNVRQQRWFGRYCGALFSLGYGVVVLAIALGVGVASERWDAPAWLEVFGAWTSILFLTLIGIVNLYAVLNTAPDQVVAPVGLKGRLLGRLNQAGHPLTVALVGALFALSFDTVSQSALFAFARRPVSGPRTRSWFWSQRFPPRCNGHKPRSRIRVARRSFSRSPLHERVHAAAQPGIPWALTRLQPAAAVSHAAAGRPRWRRPAASDQRPEINPGTALFCSFRSTMTSVASKNAMTNRPSRSCSPFTR